MRHYYQLVKDRGKYDDEYTLYEARTSGKDVQIAAHPFVLVGNHPDEIEDTLKLIMNDIKKYPPVDKYSCNIFHETMWHDDDEYLLDENLDDIDDQTLLKELGV